MSHSRSFSVSRADASRPQIDDSERESTRQRLSKDLDRERVARTPEEMAREAETLRRICGEDS